MHSPDGLNEMVYNRCIGTRLCSNNCPYKVRRFNWFAYSKSLSETDKMGMNSDVTVRARGVMEKCTFCVQRIREHQLYARAGLASERPAPLVTACQQACPTGAIAFGDLNQRGSPVAAQYESDRAFSALFELGTRPRVRYLMHISNLNPEMEST